MVQKSGDHQLRLVFYRIIYKVLAPSQVVIWFTPVFTKGSFSTIQTKRGATGWTESESSWRINGRPKMSTREMWRLPRRACLGNQRFEGDVFFFWENHVIHLEIWYVNVYVQNL